MSTAYRLQTRATVLALATLITVISPSVWAKDPCKTVMCMWGKLGGDGSNMDGNESECEGPIADFFDIQVKKKGKFKPDATADARKEFLNSCPGSDENQGPIGDIIGQFGKQK